MNLNENTLKMLQEMNPQLMDITIKGNMLFYKDKSVDISNFSISELTSDESPLVNDISSLSSEDVFNIINIHALVIETKNKGLLEDKKENVSLPEEEKTQLIAQTFKKKDSLGNEKQYIHVVDSFGKDNVYVNDYHESFEEVETFVDKVKENNALNAAELCGFLEHRFRRVHLTDTYDMLRKDGTSEDFANKIRNFDYQHHNDKNFAVGNEEEDILISNDHTVSSYKRDFQGNLIQQNFTNAQTKEVTTLPSSNNNKGSQENNSTLQGNDSNEPDAPGTAENDFVNKDVDQFKVINLISIEKFKKLVNSIEEHTKEEEFELGLINAYFGELMLYRDYLLPDLKRLLQFFEQMMLEFATAKDGSLNKNQSDELDKYYELIQKNDVIKKNKQEKNKDLMIKKLELQKPQNEGGYIKTRVLVIVMLVITALLSLAGICYLLIK